MTIWVVFTKAVVNKISRSVSWSNSETTRTDCAGHLVPHCAPKEKGKPSALGYNSGEPPQAPQLQKLLSGERRKRYCHQTMTAINGPRKAKCEAKKFHRE